MNGKDKTNSLENAKSRSKKIAVEKSKRNERTLIFNHQVRMNDK
jgi:hypothetical protein